jgi:nitric oxide reductase activation protein
MPSTLKNLADEIGALMMILFELDAVVEDAAEATLRAYSIIAKVRNEQFLGFNALAVDVHCGAAFLDCLNGDLQVRLDGGELSALILPPLNGSEREYLSPQAVDYRGDFQPELAQLLSHVINSREQRRSLTAVELADLLRSERLPRSRDSIEEDEEQESQTSQMVQNLLRELERKDPRMRSVSHRPSGRAEDDSAALSANQPNTFVYDEWSVFENQFRSSWCKVYEKTMSPGELTFYRDTLWNRRELLKHICNEFEQLVPELYRKIKRLTDGTEHDLDASIEAHTDRRAGVTPSDKVFWRQHKIDRDVAVAFLVDMSGSTGEAISDLPETVTPARSGSTQRRIIDVEREAIVLMAEALEAIGDRFGVYGFSGHGRDNVEFYIIKDFGEELSLKVARRYGRIGPLHATRMGPAIRHTITKLRQEDARAKFLFLISDGRPQDRGYSQESSEKEYAVHDTRMALLEARGNGIHPFCLTVDKEGNDYLRKMMGDFSYEVVSDVTLLPLRLPQLYRKLTM